MRTVSVNASEQYDVIIGEGQLDRLGSLVASVCYSSKAAVISDTNVWPLYGNVVTESLKSANIEAVEYVFLAGEGSKNADTYLRILSFLAEKQITRSDMIIALGGGVVGDMAGFVAGTYLRGISYIQVPTSLLAMVDSSVGGKTAIDLPAGKNLVGAFKQPKLVICDTATLATLPKRIFLDGCAEVIKYGMLYDVDLIDELLVAGPDFDLESVVAKCVSFKRDVVQEDEFDTGTRQKLNLGHTIGHGIEARSNFQISHGQAVAAGMSIVTKASVSRNLCPVSSFEKLIMLLQRFELPINTEYTADELFTSALSDKKRSGGTVNLIIPRDIGQCDIVPVPVSELKSFIEAAL